MVSTNDRSGKVKIATLLWLVLIAAGVYVGIAFGGVYWRRYMVTDKIDDQMTFAGQIADETIQAQLQKEIGKMHLPPEASRFRVTRTGARTIQVTIKYTEKVNLLYTTKKIPISITERRTY